MITFTRRSLALLPAVAPLLSPALARAAELNPAAVAFKLPDQIKWSEPSPAGTFVTHFGQQVHFDGAKDEDAVLLIVGEGPGTSTPAEVK